MSLEQAKVTLEWDSMAGEWDDLASGYRDGLVGLWDQHDLIQSDLTVVDFGCGSGLLTEKLRLRVKKVICIDASPLMMEQVRRKILQGQWDNGEAQSAILSEMSHEVQQEMEELYGTVDLTVASSVLSFIPDLAGTVKVLGKLLKNGGKLVHSDWPKTEKNPEGFSIESVKEMHKQADLETQMVDAVPMHVGDEQHNILWGIALKK